MFYDQGYYYGKMDSHGLTVHNSSGQDNKVFESVQRRPKEFDSPLVSEYIEYSDTCRGFCYIGAIAIDQGAYNARYDTLHHIFVPKMPSDLSNPYSYIRYVFPHYYRSPKSLDDKLSEINIPEISLEYHELLQYCGLDGEENTRKFARLLEIMYSILFMDKTAAVILPEKQFEITGEIPEYVSGSTPENCYQAAAALMLLLHLLVPDCFLTFNSVEKLRLRLKYSIVRDTSLKNSFCFVEENNAVIHEGCETYDWSGKYNYSEDSFYFVLAREAQKSVEDMQKFLAELCEMNGGKKFSARQLNLRHLALNDMLRVYRESIPRRAIWETTHLITWGSYIKQYGENVFYPEYISNLSKYNGYGQISDDNAVIGFWNVLKEEDFRKTDETVFLLNDCSDTLFITLLKDVIDREEIMSALVRSENIIMFQRMWHIFSVDELKEWTELFGSVSDREEETYSDIFKQLVANAEMLYNKLDSLEEKRQWFIVMKDSGLYSPEQLLEVFVWNNSPVGNDAISLRNHKNILDFRYDYDKIILKKISYVSAEKCKALFNDIENNNNIRNNKEDVQKLMSLCEEIEKELPEAKCDVDTKAVRKYYRQYDIQNALSAAELGEYPEDDIELQECYILRLAELIEERNKDDIKFALQWRSGHRYDVRKRADYRHLLDVLEKIGNYYTDILQEALQYNNQGNNIQFVLKECDFFADTEWAEQIWNSIRVEQFPVIKAVGYTLAHQSYTNRQTLFCVYDSFERENCPEKITLLRKDILKVSDDVKELMKLEEIRQKCCSSRTAMTNYLYLASILNDKNVYRTVYENFGGNILPYNQQTNYKNIQEFAEKLESYAFTKSYLNGKNITKDEIPKLLAGVPMLDKEEQADFKSKTEQNIQKELKNAADKILEKDADIRIRFESWKSTLALLEKYFDKQQLIDIKRLKNDAVIYLSSKITVKLDETLPDREKNAYRYCQDELCKMQPTNISLESENKRTPVAPQSQNKWLPFLIVMKKH